LKSTKYLFDAATRRKLGEYKLPKDELSGVKWSLNNAEIGFGVRVKPKTAEIYSITTATGELINWFTLINAEIKSSMAE